MGTMDLLMFLLGSQTGLSGQGAEPRGVERD